MIDLESTQEAYKRVKIDHIGWIPRTGSTSDTITKIITNAAVDAQIETRTLSQEIKQCIILYRRISSAVPIISFGNISQPMPSTVKPAETAASTAASVTSDPTPPHADLPHSNSSLD